MNNPNVVYTSTLCVLATIALATACGPTDFGGADDPGAVSSGIPGDGDGDTPPDVPTEGDPIDPGSDIRCVEIVPGQVSCWVSWDIAWARVMLPCQVDAGVDGLAWTEGYDDMIGIWGPVVCHDLFAGDQRFCLYSESNVILTEVEVDVWSPDVSALVAQLPDVDPPCGDAFSTGDMWGPCPVDANGSVTLCNSESLACVPSVNVDHNICLPLGYCPASPFGTSVEMGWGDACYPRCADTSSCAKGQDCVEALADGGSMCAWPVG